MRHKRYSIQFYAFLILFSLSAKAQLRTIDIHGSRVNQRFSVDTADLMKKQTREVLGKKTLVQKDTGMRKNEYYFYNENSNTVVFYPPLKHIRVTSHFGYRNHPVVGGIRLHSGIDLKAYYEPVFAIADGMIERCGYDDISGNYIVVNHGKVKTAYCHLSKLLYEKGTIVTGGEIIAISGNTGRSTGPHLHFGVKYVNKSVDPRLLTFIFKSGFER